MAGLWHRLAGAIRESNLSASDKSVYRYLLDCADYGTAELPARFTPKQAVIARKTSHSQRQVRYAIRHLEQHKWLAAEGSTGPGRTRRYILSSGTDCDCTGRVHAPKRRQPDAGTAATIDDRTAATNGGNAAGQAAVPTERQREGRMVGGQVEAEQDQWDYLRSWSRWPSGSIGEHANQ